MLKSDVTIVGGGLAGLTLACLMAQSGVSVTCVDREDIQFLSGHDERTTAISFGSQKILDEAGIWDLLGKQTCAIRDIEILDSDSPVLLQFLSSDVEGNDFGWIVDNRDLRMAMMKRAKQLKSLKHLTGAKVADFKISEDQAITILEDGRKIISKLIVGADGRQSFTRNWMDVAVREWSYKQHAVICVAHHENPHNNLAVEHFWPGGPFAVLPMCDDEAGHHRSSVVFTEHVSGRQKGLMDLDDTAFEELLNERFPDRYGRITLSGKRMAFPLSLVHAAEYIRPRMALVADAAHAIHPIAGQGLNLGFRDVKKLAELVVQAYAQKEDPGSRSVLEAYQRARRFDNMAMVAVTDGLNRLFSNNIPPIRALRKTGLRLVSKLPPAKRFFMRQAMGDR